MKTKLIQFWYWILHSLWIKRDSIYSFFVDYMKAWRLDGKVTFEDFKFVTDRFKNDWVVEHKELEEQMYGASVLQTIRDNICKFLYLTEQKGRECVIHALCRIINFNIKNPFDSTKPLLDIDKINQYIKEMATLWIYKEWKGSSIPEVAEFLRKKLKLDFWINVLYLKIPFGSDKYKELLDKWYMAVTCWKMSDKYIADFRYEGEINENYTFKEEYKYSHALATYTLTWWVQKFVDNYKDTFSVNNIYNNKRYADFVKNWVFLPNVYIIVDWDNFDFISPKEQLKQRITYTAKSTDEQEKIDALKKYINIGYEPYFQKINSFECIVGELIIAGKINNLKI